MSPPPRHGFWREALALSGSITPQVMPHVLAVGVWAAAIWLASGVAEDWYGRRLSLEVLPHELAGAALALLLILRTNAGYDRWWEARKLWGGIVNQSRNLVISALAYGPDDRAWRDAVVGWTAAFPHVACSSLRGEPPSPPVASLLGPEADDELARTDHMPSLVALRLAELLREGCERHGMDRFAFLQIDKERATLIDHIGACERILKTPLPRLYAIKIRRFIALFVLTLPFALLHRLDSDWLVPLVTMLVAYPLLSLDHISVELQNPFYARNLSHLPLDEIAATIERNVTALVPREGSGRTSNFRPVGSGDAEPHESALRE